MTFVKACIKCKENNMITCAVTDKPLSERACRKTSDGHAIDSRVFQFVLLEIGTPLFTLQEAKECMQRYAQYKKLCLKAVSVALNTMQGDTQQRKIMGLFEIHNKQAQEHFGKFAQALTRDEHIALLKQHEQSKTLSRGGYLEECIHFYMNLFHVNSRHSGSLAHTLATPRFPPL